MRQNRKELPREFTTTKNRQPDSFLEASYANCSLTSFINGKKKKPVVILSTNRKLPKYKAKKPAIVVHYNKTKGAVDTGDYITRKTNCVRKTQVWTKKLAMEFLNMACLNAGCIFRRKYQNYHKGNSSWRSEFLKDMCNELIVDNLEERLNEKFLSDDLKKDMQEFLERPREKYSKDHNNCNSCRILKPTNGCVVCAKQFCGDHVISKNVSMCGKCVKLPDAVPSFLAQSSKRKRCTHCKKDRKTNIQCGICKTYICSSCSVSVAKYVCDSCSTI